jgi:hypothetical protein
MNASPSLVSPQKSFPPRNCYCGLWEENPALLESRQIPQGFCGICERCGQPGHLRHAPGGVPYTGEWCDKCFRVVAVQNYARWFLIFAAIACIWFGLRAIVRWLGA